MLQGAGGAGILVVAVKVESGPFRCKTGELSGPEAFAHIIQQILSYCCTRDVAGRHGENAPLHLKAYYRPMTACLVFSVYKCNTGGSDIGLRCSSMLCLCSRRRRPHELEQVVHLASGVWRQVDACLRPRGNQVKTTTITADSLVFAWPRGEGVSRDTVLAHPSCVYY